MGKPPGRARRCETFCVCKEVRDNLQTYEAKTFVMALRLPEGRLFSIFKEEQPKNRPCAKDFHGKREIFMESVKFLLAFFPKVTYNN